VSSEQTIPGYFNNETQTQKAIIEINGERYFASGFFFF
jgi:hypothetical protein